MQVSRVNKVFARLGRFQIKFRWLILLVTAIITVLACLGLPHLQMSSSEEDWFDDWDKVKIDQAHFNEKFGSDDGYMVMVRADDVFAPEVLQAIDRLSRRLENEVPYADRVVSLTHNLSIPVANDEGFEVIDPFEGGVPNNPQELEAKKRLILSRESLVNNIVSDDAKETWIILALKSYEGGVNFGKDSIAPFARKVIYSDEFKSDKFEMLPTGMSYTEMEENEVISRECAMRIGFGFLVMLVCLILFVRSLRGVVVPAIATVGGIASVLGINACAAWWCPRLQRSAASLRYSASMRGSALSATRAWSRSRCFWEWRFRWAIPSTTSIHSACILGARATVANP